MDDVKELQERKQHRLAAWQESLLSHLSRWRAPGIYRITLIIAREERRVILPDGTGQRLAKAPPSVPETWEPWQIRFAMRMGQISAVGRYNVSLVCTPEVEGLAWAVSVQGGRLSRLSDPRR